MLIKIIAFILIILGALINYGAKLIVKRTRLVDKINVDEAMNLPTNDLEGYRLTKATVRIKLLGLMLMLPGVILVFIAFR